MRTSSDQFGPDGFLLNGFDYEHQAWVKDGKYVRCGHPDSMNCGCFGKNFEGLTVAEIENIAAEEWSDRTVVSPTLASLLLAEDWFIWTRDGNRVRRYMTEMWSEWLDNPIYKNDSFSDVRPELYALSNAWMIQHLKHHSYSIETCNDGTPITPEQFLACAYEGESQWDGCSAQGNA